MNRRFWRLVPAFLVALDLFTLTSCPGTDLVTFVCYLPNPTPPEWRRGAIRRANVMRIDGSSITFTEDYDGATRVVLYSFDGTTLSISWPDDGEVYHMSRADALPYPEADAVPSPRFT